MDNGHKTPLSVAIPHDLADRLDQQAAQERRTKSAVLEFCLSKFLEKGLPSVPGTGKVQRTRNPLGYRMRRYMLSAEILVSVAEAEKVGYSKAYIIEEALRVGLGIRE